VTRVIATTGYERQAKRLLTPAERDAAEARIVAAPQKGPVIPGTGGARKARVMAGGRGTRGGARVIYFHAPAPDVLVLLAVYAKAVKEDLDDDDRKAIRAAIRGYRAALAAGEGHGGGTD
jgi:hypothetical protein